MLALKFRFERGRYHATGWRRNVNEGFVDWPPSPWRIVRAIISSWKTYHKDLAEEDMQGIIRALVSSRVQYALPAASQSHTRHYVPIKEVNNDKGTVKKSLVIDSFVVVDKDDALYAVWDGVTMTSGDADVLGRVLATIRYLGRAESMCSASIVDNAAALPLVNCRPLDDEQGPPAGSHGRPAGGAERALEITDVLVPSPDATMGDLCATTAQLSDAGLSYPRATSMVKYVRPAGSLSAARRADPLPPDDIAVVRYRIDGAVRPLLTEAVGVGDAFKRAAMYWYKRAAGTGASMSSNLSGMNPDGTYLRGSHSHAFFLPTDDDRDRRIDHVTVFSKTPFDGLHVRALESVRFIRLDGEKLKVTFLRRGGVGDFDIPMLGTAERWVSATPYVPNRHVKVKGGRDGGKPRVVDGPADQARREIEARGIGRVRRIEMLPAGEKLGRFRPVQFKTWRKIGLPGFGSHGMRIVFERPVRGPLSLGHGSHFGLGMFVPDEEAPARPSEAGSK